jgi:hypothetical protein
VRQQVRGFFIEASLSQSSGLGIMRSVLSVYDFASCSRRLVVGFRRSLSCHRFFAFSPISTRRRMASYYLEIRRMSLAAVLLNVKTDPLAFVQCRKSRPLDVIDMDEHFLLVAVAPNEAVALCRVEPFHFACGHHVLL